MEQSYYSRLTKRWRVAATYNDRKGKEVKVYSFALWYNPDKYLDYGFEANYYYDDKKIGYLDLSGYLPGYVGSEYEREG